MSDTVKVSSVQCLQMLTLPRSALVSVTVLQYHLLRKNKRTRDEEVSTTIYIYVHIYVFCTNVYALFAIEIIAENQNYE